MTQEEREQMEQENQQLKAENEHLRQAEEARIQNLNPKERLYDKIHVSLRTMDIIIGVLFVILFMTLLLGLLNR
ncbi:MAG: hypothetical protein RR590_04550 [Hungatella sp.]